MLTFVTPQDCGELTPGGDPSVWIRTYVGTHAIDHPGPQVFAVLSSAYVGSVRPHFHTVDQFQVFLAAGRVGAQELESHAVHYADAYTTYGPIYPDASGKLEYFTVRACGEAGPKYMPESRDLRAGKPRGRHVTAEWAAKSDYTADEVASDDLIGPFDDGVAAILWRLRSGVALARATAGGRGSWLVVDGSVTDGERTAGPQSWVTVDRSAEGEFVTAGPDGAALLELRFRAEAASPSG